MSKWPTARLDACCEIVSGATPKTSVAEYWDGDIPWATPRDLSGIETREISDTPRKLTGAGLKSCGAAVLPPSSVLFSSRAPIGHVAVNTVPMATNQGFKSFIPDPNKLRADFLYWWLRAHRDYLSDLGSGATFKELSKAAVSRIEMPLPPLDVQERVARRLALADDLRAKRRAMLNKLNALRLSWFIAMFGDPAANPYAWPKAPLSRLVRTGDRINYGVVQPGGNIDCGVPLVRVSDLVDGRVRTSGLKHIASEIDDKHRRSRLKGDEVLVSCVGSLGVVALADESVTGFNIARAVARIPLNGGVDRTYVADYLRTPHVQAYFEREQRTVSQPTLNIKQLGELQVLLPPAALQREFAERVAVLEAVRSRQSESLSRINALFDSLVAEAFA